MTRRRGWNQQQWEETEWDQGWPEQWQQPEPRGWSEWQPAAEWREPAGWAQQGGLAGADSDPMGEWAKPLPEDFQADTDNWTNGFDNLGDYMHAHILGAPAEHHEADFAAAGPAPVAAPPPPPPEPPPTMEADFAEALAPILATEPAAEREENANDAIVDMRKPLIDPALIAAAAAASAEKIGVVPADEEGQRAKAESAKKNRRAGAPHRLWCEILLRKLRHPDFDLVPMLIGRHGANMRKIHLQTGAKVRIRGRGSGYMEVDGKREAPVPLMIVVTADRAEGAGFLQAVTMAVAEVRSGADRFRLFCKERTLKVPTGQLYMFGELSDGADQLLSEALLTGYVPPPLAVANVVCCPDVTVMLVTKKSHDVYRDRSRPPGAGPPAAAAGLVPGIPGVFEQPPSPMDEGEEDEGYEPSDYNPSATDPSLPALEPKTGWRKRRGTRAGRKQPENNKTAQEADRQRDDHAEAEAEAEEPPGDGTPAEADRKEELRRAHAAYAMATATQLHSMSMHAYQYALSQSPGLTQPTGGSQQMQLQQMQQMQLQQMQQMRQLGVAGAAEPLHPPPPFQAPSADLEPEAEPPQYDAGYQAGHHYRDAGHGYHQEQYYEEQPYAENYYEGGHPYQEHEYPQVAHYAEAPYAVEQAAPTLAPKSNVDMPAEAPAPGHGELNDLEEALKAQVAAFLNDPGERDENDDEPPSYQ